MKLVLTNVPLVSLFIRAITIVSKSLLILFLARLLDPIQVGMFGLMVASVSFLVLIAGGDYYVYSHRELINRTNESKTFVIQHHFFAIVIIYLIFIIPLIFIYQLFNEVPSVLFFWFIPILLVEHISQEIHRYLILLNDQLKANIILFIRMALWVWVALVLMYFFIETRSLKTVFLCWFFGCLSSVILGIGVLAQKIKPVKFCALDKKWLVRGFYIAFLYILGTLSFRVLFTLDRYVIEHYVGGAFLGVYSVYMSMAMLLVTTVDTVVISFTYPKMMFAFGAGNIELYRKEMLEMFLGTISVGVIVFIIFATLAPVVISFIGKPIYLEHMNVFWILLCMAFVYSLSMVPHYGLYAKGKDKSILISHFLGAFVFFISVISLVEQFPFSAVAYGLVFSFVAVAFLKLYFFYKA